MSSREEWRAAEEALGAKIEFKLVQRKPSRFFGKTTDDLYQAVVTKQIRHEIRCWGGNRLGSAHEVIHLMAGDTMQWTFGTTFRRDQFDQAIPAVVLHMIAYLSMIDFPRPGRGTE